MMNWWLQKLILWVLNSCQNFSRCHGGFDPSLRICVKYKGYISICRCSTLFSFEICRVLSKASNNAYNTWPVSDRAMCPAPALIWKMWWFITMWLAHSVPLLYSVNIITYLGSSAFVFSEPSIPTSLHC